ncbi:hypothetical protein C922_05369 [Plasmodium inui San Antonio 1]|uniref:Uncharacterized protein n=1 Tax=Plasmodium inui San Antonio 1 TaxID=1237626 RepID=W7A576_9APIC|nr:hypothetical protein C922_05369 [Plasmodium inui San Antonio 1]EUD64254.1 hypothetical protein C922_05369 [Plasmodium inui San Antonio 1]
MGDGKVKLAEGTWARQLIPGKDNTCIPKQHRYCVGPTGGGDGTVGGFLGSWNRILTRQSGPGRWERFVGENSPLRREIMSSQHDSESWKQLLTCVMYEAININRIRVKTEKEPRDIWEKNKWSHALRGGVGADWSKSALGQNMLIALACVIRGLMGYEINTSEVSEQIQKDCQEIWEEVALELEDASSSGEDTKMKDLDDFLQKLREVRGQEKSKYDGLGFILSIYYGLSRCCEYKRNYDLTGLIKKGGWSLRRIGACTLSDNFFSCTGDAKGKTTAGLNLWTLGRRTLVKGGMRAPPSSLRITESQTGVDLEVYKPTKAPTVFQDPKLQRWADEKRTGTSPNEGVVYAHGTRHTLTREDIKQASHDQPSSQEIQPTQESPRVENRAGDSEATKTVNTEADQSEPGRYPPRAPSTERSSHVSPLQTPGLTKTSERIGPGPADTTEVSIRENSESDQSNGPEQGTADMPTAPYGTIIGGVVGAVLALGSLYGISRVFLRGRGGTSRRVKVTAGLTNGVKYMAS